MILQIKFFSEKAKVASVRPVFKKNEREKIENYRSVSIVSVLHMVGIEGRIFGCLAFAHGLLEWPLSLQAYDSGALVLQQFVIIIIEWFVRK